MGARSGVVSGAILLTVVVAAALTWLCGFVIPDGIIACSQWRRQR